MDKILVEFINTLELSLKKVQQEVGDGAGMAKLTISQLQYIEAIGALGEPTITDIAHQLGITKASVTAGVNKLVQMGYVTKAQSAEDRRVFHVSLTEAGQQLVQTKKQALQTYGAFIEAALTAEEAVQLEGILTKLVHHFQAN